MIPHRIALFLTSLTLSQLSVLGHGDTAKPSTQPIADQGSTLGHGPARYRVNAAWSKADPEVAPVINSHAMVEGKDGLLYLVTDHPKNAFLVFKKDGSFVRSFGAGLVGGHGVDIFNRDGTEYLVHVDCGWHFGAEGWSPKAEEGCVTLLKTDGTIVRRLPTPKEAGLTVTSGKFMPCDAAITPNGNILVVDGYASDLVFEYTFDGSIVRHWGGKNLGTPSELSNAHGISVDTSDPTNPLVWVSSRNQNKIKAFNLEGKFMEEIDLPGAFAGQLFVRGNRMYTAVCWSKDPTTGKRLGQSGFVVVLDRATRKVISAPGGSEPTYTDGKLAPLHQTAKTFLHGHDLYVDSDHNIYVGEWNANRRYPVKLEALPAQ
jgi:DNA-binding beta-propeller fold protein YncE